MRFFLILFSLCLLNTSVAALPSWVQRDCELHAYAALTEAYEQGPYYRVLSLSSREIVISSGQNGIETVIDFELSDGCKDVQVIMECVPLDPEVSNDLLTFGYISGCL